MHKKVVTCPTLTCDDITLSVPVEVNARADVGTIVLKCNGSRIIVQDPKAKEPEKPKDKSRFEIVQDVHAKIPIHFVTEVIVKDERVDFDIRNCV